MKKIILQLALLLVTSLVAQTSNSDAFIIKVNVTDVTSDSTYRLGIKIDPFTKTAEFDGYNYNVDWGDGTVDSNVDGVKGHTYNTTGTFLISITGKYPHFSLLEDDNVKLLSVEQWGSNIWESAYRMFRNAISFEVINATDMPKFDRGISLEDMFSGCAIFNDPSVSNWDLNGAANLEGVFSRAEKFNQPLNDWDVSQVTSFRGTFSGALLFNQPLDNWKTSNAKTLEFMFSNAEVFNQSINTWDVSNVESLAGTFAGAKQFNQPLNNWNTGKVTTMSGIFGRAESFDQPIDNWDTGNVINMVSAFRGAKVFNQPINTWDVSSVQAFALAFNNTEMFNQPLNLWDISSATQVTDAFRNARSFDQTLENWYPRIDSTNYGSFLVGSGVSDENYNATIVAWSNASDIARSITNFINDGKQHCVDGGDALDFFRDTLGWSNVRDGGLNTSCRAVTLSNTITPAIEGTSNVFYYGSDDEMLHINTKEVSALDAYDFSGRRLIHKELEKGKSIEAIEVKGAYLCTLRNEKGVNIAEPIKIIK